jgi:IS5 family transposase
MYQHQKSPSYERLDTPSLQLNDMVEPTNKLRRLARLINWKLLSTSFTSNFQSAQSPSPRMIFALLYLQAKEQITYEELLERWLVTPEWQYFCGETTLKDTYPVHPSALSIWSRELGVNGSKLMCAALSPSFADMSVH